MLTRLRAVAVLILIASTVLVSQTENRDSTLHKMTKAELMRCASTDELATCKYDMYDVADELARRKDPDFLIRKYPKADEAQREVIVMAAFRLKHDTAVTHFMREVAFKNLRNELDTTPRWFALQYLAETCDEPALKRLNGNHNFAGSYPVGCMWWTKTIRTFGKCRYRPAIPHLIQSTNLVACLNISDAVTESLLDFFPGKCRQAKSYDQVHDCFGRVAGIATSKKAR